MEEYQAMYFHLFNCVTDAIEKMKAGEYTKAREILIAAQQQTEEMYMENNEQNLSLL